MDSKRNIVARPCNVYTSFAILQVGYRNFMAIYCRWWQLNVLRSSSKVPDFNKFWFSRQIFINVTDNKLRENPSSGSRAITYGQKKGRNDIMIPFHWEDRCHGAVILPSTIKRTRVLMHSVQFSGPTLATFGLSRQILIAMLSVKFQVCPPSGSRADNSDRRTWN